LNLTVSIDNHSQPPRGGDEEAAWKQGKVRELADLAFGHLKEILAGKRSGESVVPESGIGSAVEGNIGKATSEIIKPSKLVSPEDVGSVIDEDTKAVDDNIDKIAKEPLAGIKSSCMASVFESQTYFVQVKIFQDALFEQEGDKDILKKGGISFAIKDMMSTFEGLKSQTPNVIDAPGVGDGAYFYYDGDLWYLYFYYGGYFVNIAFAQKERSPRDHDAELQWQKDRLTDTGKLIVERLSKIVG